MEKGNEFLVNTKSICFMCFQEKQTKAKLKNNESERKPKIVKNEESFLTATSSNDIPKIDEPKVDEKLYSHVGSSSGGGINVEQVNGDDLIEHKPNISEKNTPFSIRVLTRFLKINLEKVFSLNVPFHSLHLLDKTELTVSLCSKCLPVVDSFVKLCQELEIIYMKIQGCLRKVHEVISQAEKDTVLVSNYRQQMVTPNPLDLIQAGIVDNLRKELLDKCATKIQNAFPRVRLEKVKLTSSEKSLAPNIDVPSLDLAAILTEENYLQSIRRSASVIFTSSMKSSQDQSQISLIQPSFQLETVIAPPSDPNSIENMDFFNEVSEEIEIQSTPTPPSASSMHFENGTINSDPLAETESMPFSQDEEGLILDKVSSPPTQHQQAEETENDNDDYVKLCKRIIKGQPRFFCELCNLRVNSRQKHKRVVHREGLLRCIYCGKGFSEYRERKLHTTIQHHFEKHLVPLMPPHMTEESFKEVTEACFGIITENRKDYSCPLCSKSHRKTNNLRGHVVDYHFDVYKAKLYELLSLNTNQSNVSLPHGGNGNNNLLEFKPNPDDGDSELEIIAVMGKSSEEILDQSFNQDLNQSMDTELEFTMNSTQLESSISEGSQSPALSQQPTQMELEKDYDEDGPDEKKGRAKYIVITGRKADGRPIYFCNLCKKSVTNTIMHKRIHHGERLLHCEHCNKEMTTAYILREHTAQFHPHNLFKSLKHQHCSDEQFSKIIDTLVSDLIKRAAELKNPGDRQKCPLCSKECKQKGRWYLHLMEQHCQELSQKVQEIQRNSLGLDNEDKVQQVILVQFQSPVPIPAVEPTRVSDQVSEVKPKTPIKMDVSPSPSSQKSQGQSKGQSEKRAANHKGNYSEKHRFICDACGSRFTQSSSLKRHEKLYCKGIKGPDMATPSETKNDVEYHPLLAQNISPSQDSLISNGISCNTEKVEQQIPSSSSIGEGLTTIDTSSLNWSFGSTSGGGNLGCSYCDKTFMFPYCQRTHLITAHRVETFSEHVPLGTSYEEVETVLSIILQDFNKMPTGMNSCNFCAKEYAQVSELESHVLISHFDEVVVKLKNLVQLREELILNPNFGASFDNFNLLNEDCVIDGNDELVGENGEGDSGNVADVQIFDLDQFPELREIYSSLSAGAGSGGGGGDGTEAMVVGGGDQDGIGIGIEQVISAGNNSDIALGDQLFF